MSQLKSKSQPRRLERVQPGRREEGRLRPRNARVSGEEAVAESDVVNGSNNGVGDGLRAEQQDLRNSSPAGRQACGRHHTTGEVRGGGAESPAGAAIRMDHEEVSMSEECQGSRECGGQNAEG